MVNERVVTNCSTGYITVQMEAGILAVDECIRVGRNLPVRLSYHYLVMSFL